MKRLGARLHRLLARETSGGGFLPVIDGLRFIAIMGVIGYHLRGYVVVKTGREQVPDPLGGLLDLGFIGVQLFFAISGFIIALPFLRDRTPGLWPYFRRRLTRLEPPYLLNLLLIYLLLVLVLDRDPFELLPHLAASAVYMHNIAYGGMSEINFVAWSLEIEFQFYVTAPLLFLLLTRLGVRWRQAVLIGLVVLGGFAYRDMAAWLPGIGASLLDSFGFFAAGILVAQVYVADWRGRPPPHPAWDGVVPVAWAALLYAVAAGLPGRPFVPALILLIFYATLRAPLTTRALCWPPVYLVGGMCYTLYLYHFYIISAVGRLVLPWLDGSRALWLDLLLAGAVVVPVVLVAGAVFYVLFEKPFMRRRPSRAIRDAVAELAGTAERVGP